MKIEVNNRCADFNSYRAARVKSLFNVESGADFSVTADLPAEEAGWALGVVVGPSGSGKSSLGRRLWPGVGLYEFEAGWDGGKPIVDCIAPEGGFDEVTGALAAVGLGDVPAWLRPHWALSTGERFRAGLAKVIAERPERVVIDEFTSVVDRQIAKVGALAFAKSWRRLAKAGGNQCVLLTCHYDVLDWLEPDWVFDTAAGKLTRRCLQRPKIELEIWQTDWRYWPLFEPHHYLTLPQMIAAKCYVGTVDGEPVCHVAMSSKNKARDVEARGCRLVVMPEWQGAGVGLKFLNQVCQWNYEGAEGGRFPGRPVTTIFHTSHPGLAAALRRDRKWRQVTAALYGQNKTRCAASLRKSAEKYGTIMDGKLSGFGGHFRAVQGFRYVGEAGLP